MTTTYKGILLVWSLAPGAGKTTALAQATNNLKDLLWIRNDSKPLRFPPQELGHYQNIKRETHEQLRYQVGEWFCKMLEQQDKARRYQGLVVDTWYWVGECISAMVDKAPGKYRENYSGKPEYKYPQIGSERHRWQAQVLDYATEIFDYIGLSAQSMPIRDNNGVDTGLLMPEARPEVIRAATDIWLLTKGPGESCPTLLVTKQGAKNIIRPGERMRTHTILPERATPLVGEDSVWDMYQRYYDNPIDTHEILLDNEKPNQQELSYIRGIMTPEQRAYYKMAQLIKKQELEASSGSLVDPQELQLINRVRELEAEGQGIMSILTRVNEEMGLSLTPGEVSSRMNGA